MPQVMAILDGSTVRSAWVETQIESIDLVLELQVNRFSRSGLIRTATASGLPPDPENPSSYRWVEVAAVGLTQMRLTVLDEPAKEGRVRLEMAVPLLQNQKPKRADFSRALAGTRLWDGTVGKAMAKMPEGPYGVRQMLFTDAKREQTESAMRASSEFKPFREDFSFEGTGCNFVVSVVKGAQEDQSKFGWTDENVILTFGVDPDIESPLER